MQDIADIKTLVDIGMPTHLFNPKLFQKGLDATMIEITKWAKGGKPLKS